jgi:hypothetical protein
MPKLSSMLSILRRGAISLLAFTFIAATPAAVTFADDCTPPSQSQAGVHWPTGSDAGMFTYQCSGDYSGKWLSDHYVFDPSNNTRTPLVPIVYNYNASTDLYDASVWDYNAAQAAYQLDTVSVQNPPAGATTNGTRPAVSTTPTAPIDPTSATDASPASSQALSAPDGTSSINQAGTNNVTVNNGTTVNATTGIISFAGTGSANVSGNNTAGSAASGNAQSIANVINMLQSSSNVLSDPNMITFTANINGDVNGDLLLNPATLGAVQPANTSASLDNNVIVNNSTNSSLTNTVNLGATSGSANVSGNTTGGDATTGNATAVANIVNTLNSYVTAGKSFLGVININGNLNGDILLPPDFVDTLLASNVPHYNITTDVTNNTTVANINNASITNNVAATAASGSANVSGNTNGGSASSGSAKTNLTVFNLTGSEVVASNDLLVFVNVLGSWYGMILNAPAGTTAASLGSGVASNTTADNTATLNNTNNQSITNNVNVTAQSGDANVSGNTNGGNAKTGDASAAVNIFNMINDKLTLNGWFGLLFINVFGTWNGSFGVNTSAGDPVAAPQTSGDGTTLPTFQFAPSTAAPARSGGGTTIHGSSTGAATGVSEAVPTVPNKGVVLAAKTIKNPAAVPSLAQSGNTSYLLPLLGGGVTLVLVLASERNRIFRRH